MPSSNLILKIIRKNLLTILTLFAVVFGSTIGIILRNYGKPAGERWTKREIAYVGFVGELFLRALKAMIIPLLVSSVISAVGFLDISHSKKIALRSIAFYATTTVSAVILGIILVLIIQPGVGVDIEKKPQKDNLTVLTVDTIMDLIRNVIPENLPQAAIEQVRLFYWKPFHLNPL